MIAIVFLGVIKSRFYLQGTATLRSQHLQTLQNVHALLHLTEHDVVAVQPGAGNGRDEELRTVGVGTAVGHRQKTGSGVLQGEVLVRETLSVDGLASRSVSVGEITALSVTDSRIDEPGT